MSAAATTETDARDLKISEQANVIVELTKLIEQLKEQNKELEEKVKRLEALLAARLDSKSSKKPVFAENYSLERNKLNGSKLRGKNSDKKSPKTSTGRKPAEAKEHLVSDTIEIFPEGVDRDQCRHHRFQSAWRIVDGKAVYLRYDIRDLPEDCVHRRNWLESRQKRLLYLDFFDCRTCIVPLRSFTKEDRSDERPWRFL